MVPREALRKLNDIFPVSLVIKGWLSISHSSKVINLITKNNMNNTEHVTCVTFLKMGGAGCLCRPSGQALSKWSFPLCQKVGDFLLPLPPPRGFPPMIMKNEHKMLR